MNQIQAEQLQAIAAVANDAGLQAIGTLTTLIEQLGKVKTLTNHCRWKIASVTDNKPNLGYKEALKQVDKATNAEGLIFPEIGVTFYSVAMSARYLQTNSGKIMEAVEAGQLFGMLIYGTFLIPEPALKIYKNSFRN